MLPLAYSNLLVTSAARLQGCTLVATVCIFFRWLDRATINIAWLLDVPAWGLAVEFSTFYCQGPPAGSSGPRLDGRGVATARSESVPCVTLVRRRDARRPRRWAGFSDVMFGQPENSTYKAEGTCLKLGGCPDKALTKKCRIGDGARPFGYSVLARRVHRVRNRSTAVGASALLAVLVVLEDVVEIPSL